MKSQVFDPIRKKRVTLTPEESVRQQLIQMLNKEIGVPLHLMSSEYFFTISGLKYRSDLVVFNRTAKPILVAECKAPSVSIDRTTFEQIFRYNQKLNVKYLLLTNGLSTYFAAYDEKMNNFEYHTVIPHYNELSK